MSILFSKFAKYKELHMFTHFIETFFKKVDFKVIREK